MKQDLIDSIEGVGVLLGSPELGEAEASRLETQAKGLLALAQAYAILEDVACCEDEPEEDQDEPSPELDNITVTYGKATSDAISPFWNLY